MCMSLDSVGIHPNDIIKNEKNVSRRISIAALFTIEENWKQYKSPMGYY